MTNANRLREVWAREDFDAFVSLFAPDAQWVWWRPSPACRNKSQIVARLEEVRGEGVKVHPEVVLDAGQKLVVDPHTDPPLDWAPDLHHVYTFRDGKIVHMEDFPDRASALAAVSE